MFYICSVAWKKRMCSLIVEIQQNYKIALHFNFFIFFPFFITVFLHYYLSFPSTLNWSPSGRRGAAMAAYCDLPLPPSPLCCGQRHSPLPHLKGRESQWLHRPYMVAGQWCHHISPPQHVGLELNDFARTQSRRRGQRIRVSYSCCMGEDGAEEEGRRASRWSHFSRWAPGVR